MRRLRLAIEQPVVLDARFACRSAASCRASCGHPRGAARTVIATARRSRRIRRARHAHAARLASLRLPRGDGLSVPGCGLTTSFAAMADAQFARLRTPTPSGSCSSSSPRRRAARAVRAPARLAVVPVLERLHIERWALVMALVSLTVWLTRCVTSAVVTAIASSCIDVQRSPRIIGSPDGERSSMNRPAKPDGDERPAGQRRRGALSTRRAARLGRMATVYRAKDLATGKTSR